MLKKVIAVALLSIVSAQASAGWKTSLAVGGASWVIKREVIPAVLSGVGHKVAVKAAGKLLANPASSRMVIAALAPYIITNADLLAGRNAERIIADAGYYENIPGLQQKIQHAKTDFTREVAALTLEADRLDKNSPRKCVNRDDIYSPPQNFPTYLQAMSNVSSPFVQLWDYGSFRQLQAREQNNDDMEHDHIPSQAPIVKYLEQRDKRRVRLTPAAGWVKNNTSALEVTKHDHEAGRSWGRRKAVNVDEDVKNLRLATIKDFAYYVVTQTPDRRELDRFANIYLRNKVLCLYE